MAGYWYSTKKIQSPLIDGTIFTTTPSSTSINAGYPLHQDFQGQHPPSRCHSSKTQKYHHLSQMLVTPIKFPPTIPLVHSLLAKWYMRSQKNKSVYPSPCEGKTTCMLGQLSQRGRIPFPYKWDGCPSYLKKIQFWNRLSCSASKCPQCVF